MTPGRSWEADTPSGVVDDVVLGRWFEPSEVIEALEAVDATTVGDRHRVTYRLRIHSGERCVCEQTAYHDLVDGPIGWLRVLCSGFRPVPSGRRSRRPGTGTARTERREEGRQCRASSHTS